MAGYAHVDGEVVPTGEATVPIRDRGFLYGDAVFETIRVYGDTPFAWDAHMGRLEASAETIGMAYDLCRADMRQRVDETLEANERTDAYVRLSVTRGVQPGRLTPDPVVDPTVVILVEPLPRGGERGEPVWDDGATCTIAAVERTPNASIPASAKTHNYLNGILARLSAREAGADEALMLDGDGYVTEGATTNVFFVVDQQLRTPAVLDRPVLPGITRATVLELAMELGVAVHEGAWTVGDLTGADEAFLTNSTWEIRPITAVDERAFERGPLTERLMAAFDRRVETTCYDGAAPGD